jgi:hypothetical protein
VSYKPPVYIANRLLSATKVALANDNTGVIDYDKANHFIVVFQIDEETGPWNAQYTLRWRNVTDSGSFAAIAATGQMAWSSSTDLVNGQAITSKYCQGTGGSGSTWQNGEEVEGAATSDAINLADERYTEIAFAVNPAAALAGKVYAFELYDQTNGAAIATGTGTLTIQGAVTYTRTLSLDGYLKKIITKSGTLDALLNKAGQEKTLTADALLWQAMQSTATLDGLLAKSVAIIAQLDALLNAVGLEKGATADALLRKVGLTKAATLDAILVQSVTYYLTATADALLSKSDQVREATTDALLQKSLSAGATLDGLLFKAAVRTALLDAVLQRLGEKTATLDGYLQKTDARTATLDAILIGAGGTFTITATLDALLSALGVTKSATLDAVLFKSMEKSAALDSLLQGPAIRTFQADALLQKTGLMKVAQLDGLLQRTGLGLAATMDAVLFLTRTSASTLDGLVQGTFTRSALLDAVLVGLGEKTVSALLDALLSRWGSVSATIDAVLYRQDPAPVRDSWWWWDIGDPPPEKLRRRREYLSD